MQGDLIPKVSEFTVLRQWLNVRFRHVGDMLPRASLSLKRDEGTESGNDDSAGTSMALKTADLTARNSGSGSLPRAPIREPNAF